MTHNYENQLADLRKEYTNLLILAASAVSAYKTYSSTRDIRDALYSNRINDYTKALDHAQRVYYEYSEEPLHPNTSAVVEAIHYLAKNMERPMPNYLQASWGYAYTGKESV